MKPRFRCRVTPIAFTSLTLSAFLVAPLVAGEGYRVLALDGGLIEQSAQHDDIAALAVGALARELDIAETDITVDTVRVVNWPDSSIGCPQPGRSYLQVITPGHKIVLRARGQIHVVHEANGNAFICKQRKLTPAGIDVTRELAWREEAALARSDLARRLGVEAGEIRIMQVRSKTWPDAGLGCAAPGATFKPQVTQGYVIRLRHGLRDYSYHVTKDRAVPCPAISED